MWGATSFVPEAPPRPNPPRIPAVPGPGPVEAGEPAATASRTTATSTIPVRPKSPPRQSRPHSHAITAAAAAVNNGSQGQPNQIATIGSGARTNAQTTRSRKGFFAENPPRPPKPPVPGSARSNSGPVAALPATG